jgi:hypothetical protein
MEIILRLRARGSLCRQHAAYRPDRAWNLLAEAEYWEYLADRALVFHFKECNAAGPTDPVEIAVSSDANDMRWERVAAA